MNRTLPLALALLIGCVAGTTASHYVSSPATAASPGATRWQQFCADNYSDQDLSNAGADGWELVSATSYGDYQNYRYCFKRPL